MTPRLRKAGLVAHIALSVGWLGAVAAYLALSITSLTCEEPGSVSSAYLSMSLLGRFVIVPLSLSALVTGIVQALGTEWGLFRHWWVSAKLLLTSIATIVLIAKVPLMIRAAHLATGLPGSAAELRFAGLQLLVHSAGGLLVLLVITTLSVFKPWGRTRCGHRQSEKLSGALQLQGADKTSLKLRIFYVVVASILAALLALHLATGGLGHHSHQQ